MKKIFNISFLILVLLYTPANAFSSVDFQQIPDKTENITIEKASNVECHFAGAIHLNYKLLSNHDQGLFRGFSDILVSASGENVLILGDRGVVFTGIIKYNKSKEINTLSIQYLDEFQSGAEDFGVLSDGTMIVAFEESHIFGTYHPFFNGFVVFSAPKIISEQNSKNAIEAVTVLKDDRILAISEEPIGQFKHEEMSLPSQVKENINGFTFGWIGEFVDDNPRKIVWGSPFFLQINGKFRVSSVTTLPTGNLLLLERYYERDSDSMHIRISQIKKSLIRQNQIITGKELIKVSDYNKADHKLWDNFEGISATVAPDGSLLIYLISDDNRKMDSEYNYWGKKQRSILMHLKLQVKADSN